MNEAYVEISLELEKAEEEIRQLHRKLAVAQCCYKHCQEQVTEILQRPDYKVGSLVQKYVSQVFSKYAKLSQGEKPPCRSPKD